MNYCIVIFLASVFVTVSSHSELLNYVLLKCTNGVTCSPGCGSKCSFASVG